MALVNGYEIDLALLGTLVIMTLGPGRALCKNYRTEDPRHNSPTKRVRNRKSVFIPNEFLANSS